MEKALMSFGIVVLLMIFLSILKAFLIFAIDLTIPDYLAGYLCGCTFIYFWKVYDERF